jgi:hypothetical protein
LSDNPQKVNGLAGITLGAYVIDTMSSNRHSLIKELRRSIVQSTATITTGCVVGLAFQWRLALVGIACLPFLVSAGYIRLVCTYYLLRKFVAIKRLSATQSIAARRCPQRRTKQGCT